MSPEAVAVAITFVFGLCVGSFLNVVIARLPAGASIVTPGSACPGCGTPIRWYDNVPLLSFAVLRGRCRQCTGTISWRYPLVELGTAVLFVLVLLARGPGLGLVSGLLLAAALVVVTGIDLDHQIIPDVVSLPGIVVGIALSILTGVPAWSDALIGVLVGGGLFFVIIVASGGGMGGGDMKLAAMLGAFLGWQGLLVAMLLAALTGGGVALVLLVLGRKGRKDPVPFGPFLALGGMVALLYKDRLIHWYFSAFLP
jgi:leader peptidase (prepilin peptidase) / N-methyltransferase